MKKIVILPIIMLCSSLWANTQDAQNSANTQPIRIITKSEITGLWGMEIPNNKKCVEYYNFKSENVVMVKSGQEWSNGIYDYQPSQDSQVLPALTLQIQYDNNEVDCSGQRIDQTGEVSQYFVKWQTPRQIQFCSNEKPDQCFATLRRILP